MTTLSDYTKEEIDAVLDSIFTDGCADRYFRSQLSDHDKLNFVNTLYGQMTILKYRIKKLGREIIKTFRRSK